MGLSERFFCYLHTMNYLDLAFKQIQFKTEQTTKQRHVLPKMTALIYILTNNGVGHTEIVTYAMAWLKFQTAVVI